MERIASFSVDHLLLEPGVYVSRSFAIMPSGRAALSTLAPWAAARAFTWLSLAS